MLKLKNIVKEYPVGDSKVVALKGIDIEFRSSEFVSILGHSGCGKTTLLNIIGGLDQYTSGDLVIKNKSTKKFRDADWDTYRNHSVGFVFQSYNLIPHQSVLANVELALTLSGVSKADRKAKAIKALEKVGLGDQVNKKPNQLSGGQMQRVAIARALVNDPEILLADEPTGALDSETSVQIMELLKEISKEKLVIMVTHNPELADEYSTRIIRLIDGKITDDTNPYTNDEKEKDDETRKERRATKKAAKKRSMSFFTALSLSMNNLLTKKMRTFLTSFAGSIGIIGIALILSLSNGFQLYINSIQREALTSYPMMIDAATMDMNSMLGGMSMIPTGMTADHPLDKVYSNTMATEMMKSMTDGVWNNDLKSFKQYLESENCDIKDYASSIQYNYGGKLNIYSADLSMGSNRVYPSPMLDMMESMMGSMGGNMLGGMQMDTSMMESYTKYLNAWQELINNEELLKTQYEVIYGTWPQNYNEVVLIVDRNNEISELAIQGLGLASEDAMMENVVAMMSDEEYVTPSYEITYEEVLNKKFKIVLEPNYYSYNEETKIWEDKREDEEYVKKLVENGEEIKVVGIIRPTEGSLMVSTIGSIGYTADLTKYIITKTNESELIKQQIANPEIDVFTGLPFVKEEAPAPETDGSETAPETTEVSLNPEIDPTVAPISDTQASFASLDTNAPAASFTAATPKIDFSTFDFSNAKPATKEEVYASIDKAYSGEEAEQMKRLVDLMLKDNLSISERGELADLMEPMLEGSGIDSGLAVTYLSSMSETDKLKMLSAMMSQYMPEETPPEGEEVPGEETEAEPEPEPEPEPYAKSYEEALDLLGVASLEVPASIYIYPKDFEAKDYISSKIDEYNAAAGEDGEIKYTDYIGLLLSSVTKIVDIISYVLIAFVAISLVVSSIMIGIITYISVLERTKEIGILRAIGASKRDISRVFNAETLIVGFVSGSLGILLTLLLIIPINAVIQHLTSIADVAQLPTEGAIILVIISMTLTFISGLIPARIASKKDPVVALRTE